MILRKTQEISCVFFLFIGNFEGIAYEAKRTACNATMFKDDRLGGYMEKMYEKKYEVYGTRLVYDMPKEVDHHVAQTLCKELDMLIESYGVKELELNFKETEFMDSSGIGVMIGRSKTMQFRGGKISASHLSRRVEMIFQSVGLKKIVEVKESETDEQ